MATRNEFSMTVKQRRLRTFSEEFKRDKILEIESGRSSISQISRQYQVSTTSINRWIRQYSSKFAQGIKIVVEKESDTRKLIELQAKIAALERLVGQKQIELEFKDKMIELAEEHYRVDIKKKFEGRPLSGSGNIEKK